MDQTKIGRFLKELRNEKGLTQEQLAEKLLVSGRTVSRWETGTNMPDISLLVELAELYGVSIPEIIDGERKNGEMNNETKETALRLSDYAEAINQRFKGRLLVLSVVGFLGVVVFSVLELTGLSAKSHLFDFLSGAGLGLGTGTLIVNILYLSGFLGRFKARIKMQKEMGEG